MKIYTAANLTKEDVAELTALGLDLKANHRGGTDISSKSSDVRPKTVTGFLIDRGDGNGPVFVAIIPEPGTDKPTEKVSIWRQT